MRGYLVLLVVAIVAVDTARSQLPATRTKKGPPPSRRGRPGDNTDRGLPSGKDVPDGRRFMPAAAPSPAAGPPPPPAGGPPPPPAGGPPPPAAGGPPPPRRGGRPGDNTDRGLPSGADVPDGRRFMPPTQTRSMGRRPAPVAAAAVASFPPQPAMPAALPAVGAPPPPVAAGMPPTKTRSRKGRPARFNDNPDFGLPSGADWPDNRRWAPAPAAPVPAALPAYQVPMANPIPPAYAPFFAPLPAFPPSCEVKCMHAFNLVCSTFGNTYNSDCELQCNNEQKDCNGECPCGQGPLPFMPGPPIVAPCAQCSNTEYSPVCVDEENTYRNECFANCDGKYTYTCDGACPCGPK